MGLSKQSPVITPEMVAEVNQTLKDVNAASRSLTKSKYTITKAHRDHAAEIATYFTKREIPKYTAGVKEHGGNIWELTALELVDNALEEAVDQFVYLYTLKQKLEGQV